MENKNDGKCTEKNYLKINKTETFIFCFSEGKNLKFSYVHIQTDGYIVCSLHIVITKTSHLSGLPGGEKINDATSFFS